MTQNSSEWYGTRKEYAFKSPEATECFLTNWFVKIYCSVEDVQDDKAFLQSARFHYSFMVEVYFLKSLEDFYSSSWVSAWEETVTTMRKIVEVTPDKISDVVEIK